MSYEKKYIKYKLKYLKLNLIQMQKNQLGGTLINWPEQNNLIKPGDILEIIEDNATKEIIKKIEEDLTKRYGTDKKPIFKTTTTGTVRNNNNESIELYTDNSETVFQSKEFPNGIKFKKIDILQNNLDINKIREQIIELEKKFKQLENNLDNHYHEVPTTGIRYFNEDQKGPIPNYQSIIKQYPSIVSENNATIKQVEKKDSTIKPVDSSNL